MTTLLQIKGMPADVRKRLQASADANFRSVNQEALAIIAQHCDGTAKLRVLIEEGLASEKQPYHKGMERQVLAKVLERKRNDARKNG